MVEQVGSLLVVATIIGCVGAWIYAIFHYNWDKWEDDRKNDQDFL